MLYYSKSHCNGKIQLVELGKGKMENGGRKKNNDAQMGNWDLGLILEGEEIFKN